MGDSSVSQRRLEPSESQVLDEAFRTDVRSTNIRLREGEYQYSLAMAIASFQLGLSFPDVKELTKKLYGEERASDIQFIRKIQTILKKMEKSNIVSILPKKKPWDLQRYALSSFRFEDVDKSLVVLATDEQVRQAQTLRASLSAQDQLSAGRSRAFGATALLLAFIVVVSYGVSVWALTSPLVDPLVFIPAFTIAIVFSLLLGRTLSR
jgi:hypothetical protein